MLLSLKHNQVSPTPWGSPHPQQLPPLSAQDRSEQSWEWRWGSHCCPPDPPAPARTEIWGSPSSPSTIAAPLSTGGHRGAGDARGGSCPPSAPFPTAVALCQGPPLLLPGGRVESRLPPHPAPQAEKVSQICRNRSGGRQRHCHHFDVTPARPTGAAITPGPRSHCRFAINSCEKGGIMQKYFLPHLHPVPTVPGAGGAWRGHVRGTRSCGRCVQPSQVGLGVPPGLRGLCRGVQGEPGRFLSSGVDSCRASCGFPLHSPPGAVTPSTHTPVPRVNPPCHHPAGAGGEPLGQRELHPPCTRSLPYIPPPLCTPKVGPPPPLHPKRHPRAPLSTPHTPHTLLSALPPPPAPPVLPQGSVPQDSPSWDIPNPTAVPGGRRMQR